MNVLAVIISIISFAVIIMINGTIARIFLNLISPLFAKQLVLVVEMGKTKNQNQIFQNISFFKS